MGCCIKVVGGNGLESEETAYLMRQWLHPLKPDLAICINAAQRDGVGRGWKGHVHLGEPGRDLNLLILC